MTAAQWIEQIYYSTGSALAIELPRQKAAFAAIVISFYYLGAVA